MMFVPSQEAQVWVSTSCYGDSFTVSYVGVVRTAQETPMGLHGLLQGQLYSFICRSCSYLTGSTCMDQNGLLRE
jgi:hypothetical protein